jgi:chromosome segregation ATPase
MSLAEIAKVGPSTLEVLKFAEASGPRKSVSLGQPQGDDVEAALEKELQQCSAPGPQEKHMSEAQQLLVSNVRTEVLMFKPNKVLLVNQLHDLVESLILDVRARESTIDIANAKIRDTEERAAAEKQHAEQEILKKEALIAAKDKELMQGQLKRSELEETIKGLEERLTTAAGIGMTAEDAARTMMQLTKAKASIEAMKKQIAELEDKVVTMERQKRQEEMALKEKKAAIERQLKETLQEYGPEKFRELTERLQEATHELDVTSQNLSKSKVAQKQQHKLVVSWRISVDDMTAKMEQQSKEMEDLRLDIEKKGITISDLEAQLWQSEQDLKKQSLQLTQLNEKMNEYIEKYTRQAAYISEMEAKWKAAEAERLLAEGGDDSD